MAAAIGVMGARGVGPSSAEPEASRWRRRSPAVRCAAMPARLEDQYRMLRLQPDATEGDVKKAFRRLALKYHPDVCKGNNCGIQFHAINEAYATVMSSIKQAQEEAAKQRKLKQQSKQKEQMCYEYDPYDMWEEWMGWEGAGIRDYSSHINPYI